MEGFSFHIKRMAINCCIMRLSEYLKERLKEHGSQARFARATKISDGTVSKWAKGGMDRAPNFENCIRIANWAGLSPLEIFEMAERLDYSKTFRELFPEYEQKPGSVANFTTCPHEDPEHERLHKQLEQALISGMPIGAVDHGMAALITAWNHESTSKSETKKPEETKEANLRTA